MLMKFTLSILIAVVMIVHVTIIIVMTTAIKIDKVDGDDNKFTKAAYLSKFVYVLGLFKNSYFFTTILSLPPYCLFTVINLLTLCGSMSEEFSGFYITISMVYSLGAGNYNCILIALIHNI